MAYGEFVSQYEKDSIKRAVEDEIIGAGSRKDAERSNEINERIREIGDERYESVLRQAESIIKDESRRDLFEVVRLIEADFNSGLFDRLRRAMAETYNIRVEKESYYLPINRTDFAGSEPGETIKQDLLNMIPGNGKIQRGFTESRQDISPLEQKPINTDFFGVWQNSVQAQEHALANMAYVRLLKGVFQNHGSETLRDAIRGTFGENMLDYIEDYISQVANPKSFTKVDKGGNRIIRFIRGSLYSSYLGWRPRSIITQLITSPWPVLSEVNLAELLQASFTVLSHPVEMWKEIERLSPMMANRSPSQMIEWIREEASRSDLPKARRAYMKFQDAGMQGLTWVDRYAVGAGWWAVYQKERNRLINSDENLTEAELEKRAAAKADEVVYETQPQSDITELSPLFQHRSEALQLVTQFQASLNVIFQNITFDIPQAFRQHQYAKGIGMITGYAIAGALLYAIQDGLFGDDDEDDEDKPGAIRRLIYAITTQFTAGVPFVSDYVDNLLQQIITGESDGIFSSPSFPAFDRALRGLTNISKGEFAKGGEQFFQGIMLFTGAPYSLARDLGKITGIEGLSDIPDVLSGEQKPEFHPEVLIGREPEE